ncbi:MAG: hypothetical protein LBD18_06775 [Treponema sp.]|nr:hypothetical protein [Treponema sp.]
MLARPPRILAAGDINWELIQNLPREIDAYVSDRFAFRSNVLSFTKRIDFFILRKSHDNKLLVGKDRWLFYIDKSLGDEFANFKKSNLFDKEQMKIFIEHLTLVNDYCEANNIKFIFMIVPTTSSVYPEKYPFPRPKGMSRSDQVIAGLPENIRKKVIFPLDYFLLKKEKNPLPMYYNNGLHWNKLGCYYAYELLYETLKKDFPNIPEIHFNFTPYIDPGEDNYAMLWWGIKNFGKSLVLMNIEPRDGWDSQYTYIKCESVEENVFNEVIGNNSKKGRYGIITENKNQSLPTALVMRDSYFVDLEPFTSSIFSRAEYVWTQPEKRNIQYLIAMPQKPDVFIWEIAERGLEAIPAVKPGEFPFD